jgi:hypothetical protein
MKMKRQGILAAFAVAALMIAATPSWAQGVRVYYHSKFCVAGEPCTVDVYVNSQADLGRLAVVLRYNNSYLTVTSLESGNYLPVQHSLRYIPEICDVTILCNSPGYCGQIEYNGSDPSESTSGTGLLFSVTFEATTNTQLFWGPCPGWCNEWTCVSLTPFARSYDGSQSYPMTYDSGTIFVEIGPLADSDGDCLDDVVEAYFGTDPHDADSDDDGLIDGNCGSEDLNNNGVVDPGETDPRDADSDDDGILDATEQGKTAPETPDTDLSAGYFVADADPSSTTDPANPDSDGDGVLDGLEDGNGNGAYEPELGEGDPEDDASQPDPAPINTSARVLLLGDGDAEVQVQAALEAAGHTVTLVDYYYDWDGVTPDVDDFEMVVLLDGYDYGYELQEAASSALQSFVARGCGLLMTEWTAYDVCHESKTGAIGDLLPVSSAPDCDYDYDLTWQVTAAHALTAGVPASWTDGASSSFVEPKPGTLAVMRTETDIPLLSYSTVAGGIVVHLNHDMTYETSTIDPNALQLIVNAVNFASYPCSPAAADSDGDGAPDATDNCIDEPNGPAAPDAGGNIQLDTDGDDYGNVCDCDFDQNQSCNISDFNVFLADFIATTDSGAGTDMDGNGSVGIDDFNLFLFGFIAGQPGPSGLVGSGGSASMAASGCGIGYELPFAFAPLLWLHRRRRL